MIGIYKITNLINNKMYIGQSVNIYDRWRKEKSNAFNISSNTYDHPISRAFRKYGLSNFSFEIIEECDTTSLNDKEKYYIYLYKSLVPYGYNIANGGQNRHGGTNLKYPQVEKIIQLLKENTKTQLEIATEFNISKDAITDINLGHSWFNPFEDYPIRKNFNKKNYCKICHKEIGMQATYCSECAKEMRRKVVRPDANTLLKEIATSSFIAVGKKYGVSDKAIVKWCIAYGLPTHKKDIVALYQEKFILPL